MDHPAQFSAAAIAADPSCCSATDSAENDVASNVPASQTPPELPTPSPSRSTTLVLHNCDYFRFDKIFPVTDLIVMDVLQVIITLPTWLFWASNLTSIGFHNTLTDVPRIPRVPFPNLQAFSAVAAPKLEAALCPENMPNLRVLKIQKSTEKEISIAGFPLLDEIVIDCCAFSALRFDLPLLRSLFITNCPSLTHLVVASGAISWLLVSHIKQLTHLRVANCPALKLLEFPPSLEELIVSDCPLLSELNHYETFQPDSLRMLTISDCPLLIRHLLRRG